ncbi:hypothetical protein ACFQYP_38065 [Nonomuraea antimicrobica]
MGTPFGPPPVAKVSAGGPAVEVTWSAAADDVAALRRAAGGSIEDYVRRGLTVSQDGAGCPLTGVTARTDGVVARFRCAHDADLLTLRVSLLHDVDAAYRTVSVTPSGSGALHTSAAPVHDVRLTGTAADGAGVAGGTGEAAGDLAALLDRFLPLALLLALLAGRGTRARPATARPSPPPTSWAAGPGRSTRYGSAASWP